MNENLIYVNEIPKYKSLTDHLEEIKQYYLSIDPKAIYLYIRPGRQYQYLIRYHDYKNCETFLWEVIAHNQYSDAEIPLFELPVGAPISIPIPEDLPLYMSWTISNQAAFKEALASL